MSDPSTTPPEEAKTVDEAATSAAAPEAQSSTNSFDEYRKKLVEQITELGTHVDGLQSKLTDAAGHARQVIENELASLKTQHPEAFARLDELRQTGDESLEVLRGRLDKLAGDLEKAVSGFLSTLADQAKRATGKSGESSAAPTQTEVQSAPPADSDKPAS